MAKCSPTEYQATLSFAQTMCGNVGITLNLPAPNNPSTAAAAAAAPQATTAAPAATPAGSGDDDSDDDTHTPATDAAVTSSWSPDADSTSTAIVSAISTPSPSPPDTDSTSSSLWTTSLASSPSLSGQSYLVQLAAPTDIPVPSSQISTTTACTNGSANRTVSTSAPLAFEGKAPGRRLQWASAALMVGVVAAFVAL